MLVTRLATGTTMLWEDFDAEINVAHIVTMDVVCSTQQLSAESV